MIPVRYHRGVELPMAGLWLDPHDPQELAFVSHAHSDHLGAHREVIVSRGTSALMRERLGGKRLEHVLEYGDSIELRGLRLTILPAGHIFGSAQSLIESDLGSLLYTGDFKLRQGLSAEPAEWRQADTLIMETTYGLPRYQMPPTEETVARMVEFCREALDEGAVPVLLGYSLGKSQEILCALVAAGLTPMLHGSVWNLTEIYRALRPDFPCDYVRYVANDVAGKVLVCPPSANRSRMITQIKNRRVAVLTGWALDPGATYRYQCDAAFPLTDHADYPDLLRYVDLVKPKRVLTLHGFAAEFARDLRERGIEAWALTEANQLELTLPGRQHAVPAISPSTQEQALAGIAETAGDERSPPNANAFVRFAKIGEAISRTASKLRKVELLAEYLRSLDSASLPLAAVYLMGRAFPPGDPRVLQTGWAIIWRALLAVSGVGEQRLRQIGSTYADAGRTAFDVLQHLTSDGTWTLAESAELFDALAAARGPMQKGAILQEKLAALNGLESSYVVRILTGDLRIGLKEGLVEEAIAKAFEVPSDAVREAHMLTGDLGEVALLAARRTLDLADVRLFRPIKCMLASPEPDVEAIWERISAADSAETSGSFWAEDKYDGIRAQIHVAEGRVEIYSRDLRQITDQFADLARFARTMHDRVILDGEILAFSEGRVLTFFDLQKRLGRQTEDDLFLGTSDVPVIYRAFDLLWVNGASLLRAPLSERRQHLEQVNLPERFELVARLPLNSRADLETVFREARHRGNEGLIIKDEASAYSPGRRGFSWLKLKREAATLDVVVVGAEQGHGKRAHVLSDYTFAVRDDASGLLLTIGKAYSGLTDLEIEELTEHFTASTVARHGHYREVRPDTVLEIAFDSIQPSARHESGLALRFPRIKAIRRDKTPAEIDTLSYARSLVSKGPGDSGRSGNRNK